MIDKDTVDIISLSTPWLSSIDKEDYLLAISKAYQINLSKGEELKEKAMVYIKRGRLKVYTYDGEKMLLLYMLNEGEKAVLHSSHITGGKLSLKTIAAEECTLAVLPEEITDIIEKKYSLFQRAMGNLLAKRLSEMISLLDEFSYSPLDERIMTYLNKCAIKGEVKATHEEIARDNATTREVITRILKKLEEEKKIKKEKGLIKLIID